MSESRNVQTVKDVYAAFGRGDVAYITDQLTADVGWRCHCDPVVPWAGDYTGKAKVPKFFDALFTSVQVQAFEPQEFVAQGDTVVSIGRFACKANKTGKSSDTRWVFVWKFHEGRIASYEQFHDPAIANAFR